MPRIQVYLWLLAGSFVGWIACIGLSFLQRDPSGNEWFYVAIIQLPILLMWK